jgi:hypothetical protein
MTTVTLRSTATAPGIVLASISVAELAHRLIDSWRPVSAIAAHE